MPEQIVVVGASGFGRETLDTLEAMIAQGWDIEIVGVVDDAPSEKNLARLAARGIDYLGTVDEWLSTQPTARYLLAIGAPAIRARLVRKLEGEGLSAVVAVHPTAVIGSQVRLSEGVVICAGAILSTNVTLGRHVHINPGAIVGHDAIVDDFASINPGAVISGEVHLGTGVLVGASATILQQLQVGTGALVGAGSLITRRVPAHVIVKGVPGRWDQHPERHGGEPRLQTDHHLLPGT